MISALKQLSEEDDLSALGYYLKMTNFELLSTTLILNDLLLPFSRADKVFQEASLPIASVMDRLKRLKEEISLLYLEDNDYGFWLDFFKEEFDQNQTFKDIPIKQTSNYSFTVLRTRILNYKQTLETLVEERFKHFEEDSVFEMLDFIALVEQKEDWRQIRNTYKEKEVIKLLE